jgi:SAM-dependent methyltransferase
MSHEADRQQVTDGADGDLWSLERLAAATHLTDWMFSQFEDDVGDAVVEIGAGIGTFSDRVLAVGAKELLLIEPEPACAEVLEQRFAGDPRVRTVRETLPESPTLAGRPGHFDFALCQNVLEHVEDDAAAMQAIARSLKPGGRAGVLVPAHPRLFGSLDRAFGHHRRYTRLALGEIVEGAGLMIRALYSFNLLGVAGWWAKSRTGATQLDSGSLSAYELLVRAWRPLEERLGLPWGLSLIVRAEKP